MEVTRTFDLLNNYKEKYVKNDALAVKCNGKWETFSSHQYIESSYNFSYGLLELGFKPNDKIATVSNNRPEWNFIDMGMSQIGVIHVPIYPTISDKSYKYILFHSNVKALIISDEKLFKRLKPIIDEIPSIQYCFTFDDVEGARNWTEITKLGKQNEDKHRDELDKVKNSIKPDDLVSIIYTSGTTGEPKGVMLSHRNFISNTLASASALILDSQHRVLSFLPLNHVYERMANYEYQYKGISIYYAENMDTIGENLKEIKPHGFATVPRLLEKIFDKIMSKGQDLPFIKKMIFYWAIKLGLRYELNSQNGWFYEFQLNIANKLVFNKWREALGGNIIFLCSGGAALQPRLARIFWAAGIPVQEGYGLTETSPIVAMNLTHYPDVKFGTVGPLLKGVEVKIANDGEILTKGPNLMLGYYKNPELTKQAIDKDGWFHTGDIGEFVEGKFLKITDRKKEIFKTSGGVYVAPQVIENLLKESYFIEQVIVVGENRRFPAAIISPNFEFLHKYCDKKNIEYSDNESIINNPRIIARIGDEVDKINSTLGQTKKIKTFRLVKETWSTETGELSAALKIRRKYLKEKLNNIIEDIYYSENSYI